VTKLVGFKAFKPDWGIDHGYEQVMRLVAAGKFPKPVKVGCRNYWVAAELELHVAELVADRDGLPRPVTPMPDSVARWVDMQPRERGCHSPELIGANNQTDGGER
jgi:hypothetical protein